VLKNTVGALSKREPHSVTPEAERTITIPSTPSSKSFHFESKVPTATAIVAWKAQDNTDRNVKLLRRMSILTAILSDRMRVKLREELGDAYSPYAYSDLSETYKNVGFIIANSSVKIEDMESVSKVLLELGDKLAAEGATQDELNRALTPRIGSLKKTLRSNSYWLGTVIAKSQTRPEHLDWSRERDADYASIKLDEINALAKQFLTRDRALNIKISPKTTTPDE